MSVLCADVQADPLPEGFDAADVVSAQLLAAGFDALTFTRFDAPMRIGRTLDEAVGFAREIGPAAESLRLAGETADVLEDEIDAALRAAFAPWLRADGVWATSSTWLVTARSGGDGRQ